jgi:hypothetical protein
MSSHGFENNVAVLKRFGQHIDGPMPSDFAAWEAKHGSEAMNIRVRDPELYALLSGTASASARAAVLQGDFSPVAPSLEDIEGAKIAARKQELFDAKPFETGNVTQQLELAAIDEKLAAKLREEVTKKEEDPMTNPQARRAAAEAAELRVASRTKGNALAAQQYVAHQWLQNRYRVGA